MPLNNHIKLIYFIVNNAVIFAVAGGAAIVVAVADVAFAATDVAATIAAFTIWFTHWNGDFFYRGSYNVG